MKKNLTIILFFFTFSSFATPLPEWSGKPEKIIGTYNKLHEGFIKELCPSKTESDFQKLFNRYRELGFFLPLLPDGTLDTDAIRNNMVHLERQRIWIIKLIDELHLRNNHFDQLVKDVDYLNQYLSSLMQDKKKYFEITDNEEKKQLSASAHFHMGSFKQTLQEFLRKAPFLMSFDYPSPIHELRLSNDLYKAQKNYKKANEIYFFRKIIEDGTSDKSGNLADINARLTLNTVSFKLMKQETFLSEDLYFDLKFLFSFWTKVLEGGGEKQLERLQRWQSRLESRYFFYKNILNQKIIQDGKELDFQQFITQTNTARQDLEKFVNLKERDTYLYWAKQTELMQALFSIETILYNEVGALDRDAVERKDITQIILNRSEMPYYWILAPEDHLYKELPHEDGRLIVGNKWLNILFKSSEFSFSYFYIHANHRIYCPEMGKLDKKLRRENLLLGLNLLKNPNWDFVATRYFSRISMPGRIDMGQIWEKDYQAFPERPGKPIGNLKELNKLKFAYKNGNWKYLYQFTDPKGDNYRVVEIEDNYWVMPIGRISFFQYRHPDYFRFFVNREK